MKYGVALVPAALELGDDGILFTAASQINLAGPSSVLCEDQAYLIASVNLKAGLSLKAMGEMAGG